MRKGEELKAPHYASAAATRDYITARDIIPNTNYTLYFLDVEFNRVRIFKLRIVNKIKGKATNALFKKLIS